MPAPGLLVLAHLFGGASGLLAATLTTAAIAILGAEAFARGRLDLNRAYRRDLRVPAVAGGLLMALVLVSVIPGSDVMASGWISERAGLDTLSVDPEATWVEIVKLLGLSLMFVMAYRYASTEDRLAHTLQALVWLTVAWALWALLLYAAGTGVGDGVPRLSGTFASPNVAACVLSIGLLCWMSLVNRPRRLRGLKRIPATLALTASGVLLSGALLLTASRAAIVIMVILAAIWAGGLAGRRVARRSGAALGPQTIALAAAALLVLACSAGGVILRLRRVQGGADARETIIATYVEAASASPAFGHGLGAAPRISRLLLTPENDGVMWNIRAVHNLPVQWWLETGAVGLAIAVVGGGWLLAVTALRLAPAARLMLLPLFMISALMLVQGAVDYPAQIYSVALTWSFVLGLAYRAATGWAARDLFSGGRSKKPSMAGSPQPSKHANQQPLRREGLRNRAERAGRHG